MVTTTPTEWLTLDQACSYLNVSRRTLYRWRDHGIVTFHRLGPRQIRVSRQDLNDALSQVPSVGAPAPKDSGQPTTTSAATLEERAALAEQRRIVIADMRAFREKLQAKYGELSDSTPFIRKLRRQADKSTAGDSAVKR
jgi:excisionase family DNA binding protein